MKAAARQINQSIKAQTSLRKQKIRSVERWYLSHCQNSGKNCFPTQNLNKISKSVAELWPKTIFNAVAVCKNEKKIIFGHVSTRYAAVYQISAKPDDFTARRVCTARTMPSQYVCLSAHLSVCHMPVFC